MYTFIMRRVCSFVKSGTLLLKVLQGIDNHWKYWQSGGQNATTLSWANMSLFHQPSSMNTQLPTHENWKQYSYKGRVRSEKQVNLYFPIMGWPDNIRPYHYEDDWSKSHYVWKSKPHFFWKSNYLYSSGCNLESFAKDILEPHHLIFVSQGLDDNIQLRQNAICWNFITILWIRIRGYGGMSEDAWCNNEDV